jgi:Tol biopolymer transport system component
MWIAMCIGLSVGFVTIGDVPVRAERTVRVNVDSDGQAATGGDSYAPSISDDGRYVAFASLATSLLGSGADTNGVRDIFLHDRDLDADSTFDESGAISTIRVSVDSDGNPGSGHSYAPAISGDGQYIVFESLANDLVDNDTSGRDIFLHDRINGSTIRVSVASNGEAGSADSLASDISDDGRYVVFESLATNLLGPGVDTNGVRDIFLHDRVSSSTIRVSVDSDGNPGSGHSYEPAISGDGRYVVFESEANDLVDDDTSGRDIFLHDRDSDGNGVFDEAQGISTERVNVDSDGDPATTGDSWSSDVSDNAEDVVFESEANNLVDGDTSGRDIFVRVTTTPTVDDDETPGGGGGGGSGGCFVGTLLNP